MRHYPDDDSTEADAPHHGLSHREQKTFLNADKGWIDSGGKTVVLKQQRACHPQRERERTAGYRDHNQQR